MKVGTPFGEFPLEYRRIERRGNEVVVVGIVAGLESKVVFGPADFARAGQVVAGAAALALAMRALRRRRARAPYKG
jgi:hypothetical protein